MLTSDVNLSIVDRSALPKLNLSQLIDPERPAFCIAAFAPMGTDKLHLIDGGLGMTDRMKMLDDITGGLNPAYGKEQNAVRTALAGGSSVFLVNLSAPGAKTAQGVIFSSMKLGLAKEYTYDGEGKLVIGTGDDYQVVSNAVAIATRRDLFVKNGNKDVNLTNPGNIPEEFNTPGLAGIGGAYPDLQGIINVPVMGFEFASPGRKGDQVFVRVTQATEGAFAGFDSSLLYLQFFKLEQSAEIKMSNKILISLSDKDKLFDTTVVFADRLGNETLEQVNINVYGSKIKSIHTLLETAATTKMLADEAPHMHADFEVLSADKTIAFEKQVKSFSSYDFITGQNRKRVIAGESVTEYNLLRTDETFNTELETLFDTYEATSLVDDDSTSGEYDFALGGGHDGIFDASTPSPFPDEPNKIFPGSDPAAPYTPAQLAAEAESMKIGQLYSAYAGGIAPEIRDLEKCRFHCLLDSGVPYEVKDAMLDLAKDLPHTTMLTFLGEDQPISSHSAAVALKKYRFNAVGDLGDIMYMEYQSIYATNAYASPVEDWVPATMDTAYKIGLSYDSVEHCAKPMAGKKNNFGVPWIGSKVNIDPDRVAGEHDELTELRINYFEGSLEGYHKQSDLTNNVADTRLSLFRNKLVLSIIYLWLYTYLSNLRYGEEGLTGADLANISNYADKWIGRKVITGIVVTDVSSAAERDNGLFKYTYDIPFRGVGIRYDGEIIVRKG